MKAICRAIALSLAVLCIVAVTPCKAAETVLYRFNGGNDGLWPIGRLVEYHGALYGTTYEGGDDGYGTAFKLTPPAKGKTAWTKTVLYSFTGHTDGWDGEYPEGGLIAGPNGRFYGTTNGGGLYGYGTVFKLVPPPDGETKWSEVVIYDFCKLSACADGTYPQDALLAGPDGSLYGTTSEGGLFVNKGTVFKLTPPPGDETKWSETVLYSFCSVGFLCDDGSHPVAELIADKQGALYGTTEFGGTEDSGTAFKLAPPAKGKTAWTETVLHSFCVTTICLDGAYPVAGLVFNQQGSLFGTTAVGGLGTDVDSGGYGEVFQLTPPGNGNTKWTEQVIHNFKSGRNGVHPYAPLVVDSQGALYGTTESGGNEEQRKGPDFGTVFKLTPPTQSESNWPITRLHSFVLCSSCQEDGSNPMSGMILYQGALYGTTTFGGKAPLLCTEVSGGGPFPKINEGCGTVYKVPLGAQSKKP